MHRRLEEAVAALAVALGDVHRGVGVADELVGVGRRLALDDRDAQAGADDDLLLIQPQRLQERLEHALGGVGRLLRADDVLEQDGELVAAEARRGVGGADARGQALGDLAQDLVAGGVAEAVVDRLEVVEVEEDDRDAVLLATVAGDGVAHALDEQGAVGEVGDRVVEGLVGELLLEGLALADVAAVEHDPADGVVLEQVRVQDLELAQRPVGVAQRALEHLGLAPGVRRAVGQQAQQAAVLLGGQQAVEARPDHVRRRVAEDALDRRALVDDGGVGVEDRDEVAGVLDERAEARLALAAVDLLGQRRALEGQGDLRGQRAQRAVLGAAQRTRGGRRAADDEQAARVAAEAEAQDVGVIVLGPEAQVLAHLGDEEDAGGGRGQQLGGRRGRRSATCRRASSRPPSAATTVSLPSSTRHRRAAAASSKSPRTAIRAAR